MSTKSPLKKAVKFRKARYKGIVLIICLWASLWPTIQTFAAEMSVEQAYKALKHKQTKFQISQARMSDAEKRYLDHLFFVTDLALAERMTMLNHFHRGSDVEYIETYNTEIGRLTASFELINPPNKILDQVERLVLEAISDQKTFFNRWHRFAGTVRYKNLQQNYKNDLDVQSAHKKLVKAYMILKQVYPQEGRHNQQAFYDHLCALDFI